MHFLHFWLSVHPSMHGYSDKAEQRFSLGRILSSQISPPPQAVTTLLTSSLYCRFFPCVISLVLYQCALSVGGGEASCHRARWDGRQDQDKIVRRHSLDRLNAKITKKKKRTCTVAFKQEKERQASVLVVG